MIAVIKNIRMFVAFTAKGTHQIEKKTGFFYAVSTATICKDIRLFKSHVSCYFSKVIVPLARMRGEQPFLFNSNFVDTMPKENEICSGVKYSTLSTTDDARQAFREKFPLVQKLKISHRKYYYFAHAVCDGRKLFCHAYKSYDALLARFKIEYSEKVLGKEAAHV